MMMLFYFLSMSFALPYQDTIPWWEQTNDLELQKLIQKAIVEAPDSQIAFERAEQSYALAQQAKQGFLPSVSTGWSSNTQPQEALGFGFGLSSISDLVPDIPGMPVEEDTTEDEYTLFTSGTMSLQINVPLDVWGKAIRNYQAGVLDAKNVDEQRILTLIALTQNIALTYWDIAVLEEQKKLLQEQIVSIQGLLEVITLRQKRGEGTSVDVLQQEQQMLALEANVPILDFQLELAHQRLAVLLGASPTQHMIQKTELSDHFEIQIPAAVDISKQIRPDLRIAQQSLVSAEKKLEVAQRDLLPTLGVGGQVYRQSNLKDGEWDSIDAWSVSSSLSVSVYQGGRKNSAIQAAQSGVRIAELNLVQVQLRAEQEIQGALANYTLQQKLVEARKYQSHVAKKAYEEAKASYIQGISPLIAVLTAQQAYQQSQSTFIQNQRDFLSAQLQLISALGGDWTKMQAKKELK